MQLVIFHARPIRPHQKKRGAKYRGIRVVGGKIALIPVVSSSGTTYVNVVSVPAKDDISETITKSRRKKETKVDKHIAHTVH